jgi:hypothetical protein
MGAIYSILADAASKGLSKLADSKMGGEALDFLGTKAMEFSRSTEAKQARQLLDRGKVAQAQSLTKLDATHSTLVKGIAKDISLSSKISLDKTPLRDVTDHLTKINHPLAKVAQNLEAQTPDNYTRTLKEIHTSNQQQSRLDGIAAGIGSHAENLTPLINSLQESADPRMHSHALRLLDNISAELRDTTTIRDPRTGAMRQASSTKVAVAKALTQLNKYKQAMIESGEKDIKLSRPQDISEKAMYTRPGAIEKNYSNWVRMVQVPLVAIPHIGQYFNLGSGPMDAIGKTLFSMGDKELDAHVEASGVLSMTMHDMMHSYLEGRTGFISKTPFLGPTAGEILYKGVHAPGFSYMREKQLWFGAAIGYHSAIEWAAQAVKGNRRALAELAEMGIDSQKVIARGGKLTEEELHQGMFHFVNNRLFISRLQDQSLHGSSNIFMRSATMYHSFLNSQVSFMRREMDKMIKAGDIKGIAQFAGTLGVLFPSVAPILESLEMLGRTGNVKASMQNGEDDYRKLSGQKGIGEFGEEYLSLLAHIGGMGVYMNYMNAAKSHRVQAALLGPIFSTPATAVEDAVAAAKATKKGKHNIGPILRDTLQDTLPLVGKPLSHWLAPTTKEKPKTRLARRGRRSY